MKKYKSFTLVELLIVMGIIVILMSIGIAVGRYALQRANRIEHQNAADELYRSLLSFKNDNGYYPMLGTCSTCIEEQFFAEALGYKGTKNYLSSYLNSNEFSGGTDATYYYYPDPIGSQLALVCVSLGGIDDEYGQGYYCTGDAIGYLPREDPLLSKGIDPEVDDPSGANVVRGFDNSDWYLNTGFASTE